MGLDALAGKEDIPALVRHILERIEADEGLKRALSTDGMRRLMSFGWPGNVRQLENVLRAAATLSGEQIEAADVAPLLKRSAKRRAEPARRSRGRRGPRPKVTLDELREALRAVGGDSDRAAERLAVTPRSVYRYMAKWGVEP